MSIRARVALVVFLPLTLIVILAGSRLVDDWKQLEWKRAAERGIDLGILYSNLIHELQKERGMSAGRVASGGKAFTTELPAQRLLTDQRAKALFAAYDAGLEPDGTVVSEVESRISAVIDLRGKIDRLETSVAQLVPVYTGMVERLMTVYVGHFERFADPSTVHFTQPFSTIEVAKEAAGLERAMGAVGFGRSRFEPDILRRFTELGGKQVAAIAFAMRSTDAKGAEWIDAVIGGAKAKEVERYRLIVHSSDRDALLADVTAEAWFSASTEWINSLKSLQDQFGAAMLTASAEATRDIYWIAVRDAVLTALILLVGTAVPLFMGSKLSRQIIEKVVLLRLIKNGKLDNDFGDITGKSEIADLGRMAKAFQQNEIAKLEAQAEVERERKERRAAEAAAAEQKARDAKRREEAERKAAEAEELQKARDLEREEAIARDAAERKEHERQKELEAQQERAERKTAEARAQEELASQLASVIADLSGGLRRLANGELGFELERPLPEAYESLRTDFNTATCNLARTVDEIMSTAANIQANISAVSESTQFLAKRTEQQASELERTAAAMVEISESVKSSADTSNQATTATGKASENAETGSVVVSESINAMNEIEESAGKITEIINVIDDIAFQTNLLALNAGVEAARAGEAGRGFAVVASEVRALAQRCSDAAQEIKTLISSSGEQVARGVGLVNRTGDALQNIAASVTEMNDLVAVLSEANSQQSISIGEINQNVSTIDRVTQENAGMAEETTASCFDLANEAQQLAQLVHRFQTQAGERQSAA